MLVFTEPAAALIVTGLVLALRRVTNPGLAAVWKLATVVSEEVHVT
jgi:hypothetical protein